MERVGHKSGFFWILIVFIIMASMAFANKSSAKSVQKYNAEVDLIDDQQRLDFPVLDHWAAGNYEDAVWVNADQSLAPVGLPGVQFDTPIYKVNLDAAAPETAATDYDRIQKGVSKIELFGWN